MATSPSISQGESPVPVFSKANQAVPTGTDGLLKVPARLAIMQLHHDDRGFHRDN
jgi:hypothetical protein